MKRLFLILAFGIWMAPIAVAQEGGGISTAIEKRTEHIEVFKEKHPGAEHVIETRQERLEEFKERHAGATGEGIVEKYDEYYDRGKFDSLAGDDGLLTEEDWTNNRTQREAQAFGDERWDHAVQFDADGDGALDLDEAKAYKQAEKQKLIEHKGELPYLYKDHKWLENHPDAAKQLYQDAKEHPGAAKKIYRAAEEHPVATKQLYKDAQKHPDAAKKVYKAAERHPDATKKAYRAADQHPDAAKKAYRAAQKNPGGAKKAVQAGREHPRAAVKQHRKANR